MLLFDVEDTTGSISFIAWNDAHPNFVDVIKDKLTFKIVSVVAKRNPRNGNRLEMKLYHDTRVERWQDMALNPTYGTLLDAKNTGGDAPTVRIKCIVCNLADDVEKTRGGDDMRRAVFMDASDQIPALFIGEALVSSISFQDGAILNVDGRMVTNNAGGFTVFVNTFQETTDNDLQQFWLSTDPPAKRARIEITSSQIVDIKSAEIGSKSKFVAAVRSCSGPMAMANDRIKRTFTVVDKSMVAVDVGLFTDKNTDFEVDIGAIVKFVGTVSAYNTRSLTTNAMEIVKDDAFASWWSTVDPDKFEEISVMPQSASSSSL